MREGWRMASLGDVADTRLGKTLPRGSGAALDGLPYLRNVNVRWNRIDLDRLNRMPFGADEQAELSLRKGDLLICEGGEVGRLTILGEDLEGVFFQNALHRVRVRNVDVMPEFVALSLEHFVRSGGLEGLVTQVTIAHLNQAKLRALPLKLPPLSEQLRIVDLIGALDDTRAAAQAALSASPYRQMLKALGDQYEPVRLDDVVDRAFAGGTPSRQVGSHFDGGIPWLKSGEVENDHIVDSAEHISDEAMRSSSARLVPSGATVVAMYGQGDTKGRAGFVESPVTTNQAVLALVPNVDRIHSRFLLHAVRSRTESLRSRAVGAAQPNLSKGLVLAETVPVPQEMRDQRRWADLLDAVRRVESDTEDEHLRLQAARSSLLTALLSGEHEIPESYDEFMGAAL